MTLLMVESPSIEKQQALWQTVQQKLRGQMSQPSFETWISPLILVILDEEQVVLQAESDFNKDLILKRYRKLIEDAFLEELGYLPALSLNVVPTEDEPPVSLSEAEARTTTQGDRPWTPRVTKSNLNPKYTFETFVVGQHNRFCHAAALAVAEAPSQSYNPFFIYGGVGLGKTHLMQAIGHFALQNHPQLQVRYVTAEEFTNEMIHAISQKGMKEFQNRYRKNDILIVDDVQFLEGKTRTQEEMFHTFNTLHSANKQIILSSDRSPKRLSRLEDRLRSRFEWGLIADIQPADLETRIAILQQKAERENVNIGMEVLTYIAELHPNNIRELEGALNKIAAYGMITRTPIDMTIAQTVFGTPVDQSRLSLEDILEKVASYYHLRPLDLKSASRAKDLSHARQIAIYLIREMTQASFPKIGSFMGGRKHTTVLYAYEKVKEDIENRPILKQQLEELKGRIHGG
jgi:chromosomal replication initiator protein